MRKLTVLLGFTLALGIVPSALAYDCNNRVQVQITGQPWEYAINHLDTSSSECWSVDAGFQWNSGASMWEFTTWYQQSATRTVTAGSGSSSWVAQCTIDFYSPTASWWEYLGIDIDVNHGGSHTYYNIYSNHGNSGTSSDSGAKWTTFSAVSGDTVSMRINGAKSDSSGRVRVGGCYIWQYP